MTATLLFDDTRDALLTGDVHRALSDLYLALGTMRAELPRDRWGQVCTALRRHELHALLLQSPFTKRAFEKPRGYAGDAELIDFIYGCGEPRRPSSTLGELIYSWEFEMSGFRSVRHRRMCLAKEIDAVADHGPARAVLAVACGHLREAALSTAVGNSRIYLTALDQDAGSLAVLARDYGDCRVTACLGTVRDILARRVAMRDLGLAYAAGLFDYLSLTLAGALTAALFGMLAHGGRFLVANFTPDAREAGYMETAMDWQLVYRDEGAMLALLKAIPERVIDRVDQFRDPEGNITYMRVVRR